MCGFVAKQASEYPLTASARAHTDTTH